MGNCVSSYGESKKECYENYSMREFSAGVCSMRGSRKTMQDSHCICLSIPNHPFYSLFAVFDGFNGYDASQYLRNNLVETLNELHTLLDDKLIIDAINKMNKTFLNSKDENININAGSTLVFALIDNQYITMSSSALSTSFRPCSVSYPSYMTSSMISSMASSSSSSTLDIAWRESIPSMSTTSSLYREPKYFNIRIFWAGNSRALIMRKNNKFEALTVDHHCCLPSEKKRVCNSLSNGKIINGKIDGITELSRSFGCYPMKNNKDLKDNEQKQISVAECKHISCKTNETLLLFTDGLLQKWRNKQVVKYYNFHYQNNKNYPNSMVNSLNYLCEQCIDNGSRDNITAISIKFK